MPLAIFFVCTAWFLSDLVGNLQEKFSHIAAHALAGFAMYLVFMVIFFCFCHIKIVCINVAVCDLVHDVKTVPGLCQMLTTSVNLF